MDMILDEKLRDTIAVYSSLQRETDDATARPVFVVFRRPYSGEDFKPHAEWTEEDIKEMQDEGIDSDAVAEAQDRGARHQAGRSDFNPMDIAAVFWTREEADDFCKRKHYNGPYFSWGCPAGGVLAEIMDYTCKREIERRKAKELASNSAG